MKKNLGFRAVLHTHGAFHSLLQIGFVAWAYYQGFDTLAKRSIYEYDSVIASTPIEKELIVSRLGVRRCKVEFIPNGIEDHLLQRGKISERESADSPASVLFLGRIAKEKNLELLVDAFRYIGKRSDAKLILAGPDEGVIGRLKSLASNSGTRMEYVGEVHGEEKYELLSACTVFAHPGLLEAFSVSLLEAQAFGKPCIVTGNGGQLYTAPPGETSLYARADPLDFANKILILLNDKSLYQQLSTNARKWSGQHVWSLVLPRYSSLYDRVCTASTKIA